MDKTYDPAAHEARLYDWWEAEGFFTPERQIELGQADPDAEPFVISMPPPNVTGQLHTGHALTAAMEDLMVRYHRLRGVPTLWIPGTDHAGIATQSVVERHLAEEGTTREELGREAFVDRVWDWKEKYGGRITEQHRRLGVSVDWDRERFTLDEGLSRAVTEAFLRLHERGLIYRGTYLVNWDPALQSVISDIEVEYKDVPGTLYTFLYPLEGGGSVPVATTRPETILGDTAVAVHPEDDRYAHLVGRTALVPMLNRRIPVIADSYVDREFGTGALKITPAHDPNDYEIGKSHGLEQINILAPDGTLNEAAGPYAGMGRLEARERLWSDMAAAGLTVSEEDYVHSVAHSQRSHGVVEPMLSTQWFVKMVPLAEPAIEAVRDGRVRIVPERFAKEYYRWMENIRDWVISRQLWWGHRIPVWYGPDGQAFAARDEADARDRARAHYGDDVDLERDEDVLDTWFSSALWPFSTLGWPERTADFERFYPTSTLETGYDILFFWVARMIFMGLEMTGEVPFDTVYLHGLVRDADGRKMSKSLGNAMDPLELIETYGCDAVRFTMVTGSTPGVDMKLTDERLEGSRNFSNKLWNVGRFILSNLDDDFQPVTLEEVEAEWDELPLADRWIVSRANRVTAEVTRLFDAHQYGEAGRQLYDFTWSELADWYVEASKVRLYGDDAAAAATARRVLVAVFERALTLLHPLMPFVTEALWQNVPRGADAAPALIVSRWPAPGRVDDTVEADFALVRDLVRGVRNARAEYDVEPGKRIAAIVSAGERAAVLERQAPVMCALARLDEAALVVADGAAPPDEAHATVIVGDGVEAWLPLAGMVDLDRERERLGAECDAVAAEVQRVEGVLANEQFVARAPAEVVQRERDRLEEAAARLATLRDKLEQLG
ncbi:MAG: valine--tRNA ligase [Anaerolineae bacterium]